MTPWILPLAAGLALLWKGQQLLRDPQSAAMRVVVANIALAEAGNLLAVFGAKSWLPASVVLLLQNLLLVLGTYLLVAFFLFASRSDARSAVRLQLLPMGAVLVGMVAAWTRLSQKGHAAGGFPAPGAAASIPVAVFYLLALGYFGYTNIVCIRLALRVARYADTQPAVGLRIATAGLGGAFLFLVVYRVACLVLGYAGLSVPIPAAVDQKAGLLALVTFLAGLCWPGFVTRGRAAGRLARLWQRSRRLRPLHRLLHPVIEASEPGAPASAGPHQALRRWLRSTDRWVECRDGLVVASAYLPEGPPPLPGSEAQVTALRAALERQARGYPPGTPRAVFAVPTAESFDADLESLIGLSRAVARASP